MPKLLHILFLILLALPIQAQSEEMYISVEGMTEDGKVLVNE